jgi:hypothetical protein
VQEGRLVDEAIVFVEIPPIAGQMSEDVIEWLFASGLEEFQRTGGCNEGSEFELRLDLVRW